MGIFGPKLWIEVFDSPLHRAGRSIAGTVNIHTGNSLDVLQVDIVLRCRERVSVVLFNGASAYRSSATWQRVSLRSTVFPSSKIQDSSDDTDTSGDIYLEVPSVVAERDEMWRSPVNDTDIAEPHSRFTQSYTLNKGTHKFPFEFIIPDDQPSSVSIDNENGIFWYLEARTFRHGILSLEKYATMNITVAKSDSINWNPTMTDHKSCEFALKAYLAGYSEAKKLNRDSRQIKALKENTTITLYLCKPVNGLLQAPYKLNVLMGMASPHARFFFVRAVEVYLRRRVYAKSEPGVQQEYSKITPLINLKGLNASFEEAIAKVNAELDECSITAKLTESHRSTLIAISYKLVAELTIVSKERLMEVDKLRISAPVIVHSHLSISSSADDSESLPRYSA